MPSRRWHPKSKLGCLQCKQRRLKCDGHRPSCSLCARSLSACIYPYKTLVSSDTSTGGGVPTEDHWADTIRSTAGRTEIALRYPKKRWHQKSRSGCLRCKERRIKCDEALPLCSTCARTQSACAYPPGISTLPPTHFCVAQVSNATDAMAFEYFHLFILPMLRLCQPSALWTYLLGYSSQINDATRDIAIAVGFQQRSLETPANSVATLHIPPEHQCDMFYGKAVTSFRAMVGTAAATDAPMVGLCCLLMVALECLRGSPKSLLLHLQSAVRIVAHAMQSSHLRHTEETLEIVAILQNLCVSAWLFCTSANYTGDYASAIQDVPFHELLDYSDPMQPSIALEAAVLGSDVLYTVRQLGHRQLGSGARSALFEQLYRLQIKARDLERVVRVQTTSIVQSSFVEAKLIMNRMFLAAILVRPKDQEAERQGFWSVLDLLEVALLELNSSRRSQPRLHIAHPFTISSGAIFMLETIIQAGHDAALEHRAISLLTLCPSREGLWSRDQTLFSYLARKADTLSRLERVQGLRRRSSAHGE